MKRLILNISFLLFIISNLSAQSIDVMADTDSSEYYVGDYIRYKIVVSHDKNITVHIPSVKDSITNLDYVKEFPPTMQESANKEVEIYNYVFSKYDSAEVEIPAFNIQFTVSGQDQVHTLKTNPVTILVKTMEIDPQGDIQDVKAPLTIPLDWWLILILVLVVLLLIGGGIFGFRYFKAKQEGKEIFAPKVVIPPYKTALKALFNLEEKKLWQQGEVKEYHSEITGIIRTYFENRFEFSAMEMPSSEVLDNLKHAVEAQPVFDVTREFLENADMVKFAKFQPIPSVNEEMMKQAYDIVNKTKQREELFETEETADVQ